jgi:ABC-type antimicrobial peptide transport system permease subunit
MDAVVNEAFARRFFPSGSALGRRVTIDKRVLTIVGVARGGRYDYRVLDDPNAPFVYYALAQSPARFVTLHARTDADPVAAVPSIRRVMTDLNPAFATLAPMSLENYVAGPLMPFRIGLVFLGLLGLVALALAAMGLRAIVAYDVAVRTREIGIRLTLGASAGQISGIFLRQSFWMTGAGIVAGLTLAFAMVPVLRQQTGFRGAVETGLVLWPMILLTIVGLAAGHLTAWRATRVDPARTLREE